MPGWHSTCCLTPGKSQPYLTGVLAIQCFCCESVTCLGQRRNIGLKKFQCTCWQHLTAPHNTIHTTEKYLFAKSELSNSHSIVDDWYRPFLLSHLRYAFWIDWLCRFYCIKSEEPSRIWEFMEDAPLQRSFSSRWSCWAAFRDRRKAPGGRAAAAAAGFNGPRFFEFFFGIKIHYNHPNNHPI